MISFCEMYDLHSLLHLEMNRRLERIQEIMQESDHVGHEEYVSFKEGLMSKLEKMGCSLTNAENFRKKIIQKSTD